MHAALLTRSKLGITFALAVVLAACAHTAAPPPNLPQPDENGTYLFWTPDEQLVGYRNIEHIFPTRTIARGDHVAPLPYASQELDLRLEVDGETWTADDFMERTRTVGLLVIRGGEIALERYAFDYGPDQRWTSFSVGKSITSTLAGAALRDGAIESLDDPVTDYLPGLAGSAYEGVTVRQLLTMTSGVQWNEDYDDPNSDVAMIRSETSLNGSDPIVTYMARRPREAEPGTTWVYKTGETNLVGSLVSAATGKTLADYLSEKIWAAYGMEHDAVWMLNAGGVEFGGCCISASLRDFGRFGLFFMEGAQIDGEPIVADGWIKAATTAEGPTRFENGGGYGFQWWITDGAAYRAVGIFGQMIYINPELELVIVTQSAYPAATGGPENALRARLVAAVEADIDH